MVYFKNHKIGFVHIPRTGGEDVEFATNSFQKPNQGYDRALQHLSISEIHQKWTETVEYTFYTLIGCPSSILC